MADLTDAPAPLDAKETAQLTEFARACKAAARAVVLYPPGHPAIAATLGRIAADHQPAGAARAAQDSGAARRPAARRPHRRPRADASLGELATLLHSHLIGEMTIHPGGDVDAWRAFLLLLGRSPESVRGDGGIARVWTTMGGRHLELREIDYAEVLRERAGGDPVVVAAGHRQLPAGQRVRSRRDRRCSELLGIAGDTEQLAGLMASLESRSKAAAASASRPRP